MVGVKAKMSSWISTFQCEEEQQFGLLYKYFLQIQNQNWDVRSSSS